jgi:hypothetical protein
VNFLYPDFLSCSLYVQLAQLFSALQIRLRESIEKKARHAETKLGKAVAVDLKLI